jgi:hypothetical protein
MYRYEFRLESREGLSPLKIVKAVIRSLQRRDESKPITDPNATGKIHDEKGERIGSWEVFKT